MGIRLSRGGNALQSSFFFSLPLNKKSYSSSRFPILDEAAPTLLCSGRGCAEECGCGRSLCGRRIKIKVNVCAGSLRQCRLSGASCNSAEGGEESLRLTYLPQGALFTDMPVPFSCVEPHSDTRCVYTEILNEENKVRAHEGCLHH